jgi:hypothetical protein
MSPRLDPRSRAIIWGFTRRLCLTAWLAMIACVVRHWPYQSVLGLFQVMCTMAAIFAMVLALWCRDTWRARTLTFWDEGMAFNALSLLTHGLARMTA